MDRITAKILPYILWWLRVGGSFILLVSAARPESLFMDNPILQKTTIIFIVVLWVIDEFRARKRKCSVRRY